jgi:probable phosphoglycerate mutase
MTERRTGGDGRVRTAVGLPYVCLVRHGETPWTITGQHTGRSDVPLTAHGEEEARKLGNRLRELHFSDVFTSPLERARRTCELAGFGSVAVPDADLVEWDYGDYEGRPTASIRADNPRWQLFVDGGPNGETIADIGARADRVIARIRRCTGNVLLFAHRDIFRVIAARWLGSPAGDGRLLYLDTGSLSMLGYDHNVDEPVIRVWNVVP